MRNTNAVERQPRRWNGRALGTHGAVAAAAHEEVLERRLVEVGHGGQRLGVAQAADRQADVARDDVAVARGRLAVRLHEVLQHLLARAARLPGLPLDRVALDGAEDVGPTK